MPPTRLLVLAVLIVTVSTQAVFLLGAGFFKIGPELDIGPVGLGALTAAFFLTASIASPPLGRWVQRVGWRRAMRLNAMVASATLLAIALAARSVVSLAACLVVAAATYGTSNPAANLALAEYTAPHRRATVFGLKHAGIPSSTLLAGLAVPVVIVGFGWRAAFLVAAGIALLVATSVPAPAPPIPRPPAPAGRRRQAAPMTVRTLLGLALGAALATWAAVALGTYLVSAAVEAGFSESGAGWLLFAGSAASILARIVAGLLTDRAAGTGLGAIAVLVGAGSLVFALLPAASGVASVVLVVLAFATGWGWPGLMTFAVVDANTAAPASVSAITQAGVFLGAGAGPLVLGAVIERWSFASASWVVAAALALAAIVVGLIRRRLAPAT
ncbi:MAG: MFS transporter [Acidimicrobiia bacterium]